MRIAVYSSKGSAGKTPISTNIALDKDYCIGTNEAFHVYDSFLPDNKLIALNTEEAFPNEIKEQDIDIVFDLAGSISKLALSISSALKMADVVIVPMYNEYKAVVASVNTIAQIQEFNRNIVVVATKLQKQRSDTFKSDWTKGEDFKNIETVVRSKLGDDIPILPLRFSKGFDTIFEEGKSIRQLMQKSALNKHTFRDLAEQFDEIYKVIGI